MTRNSTEKLASIGVGALVVTFSAWAAFSSASPIPHAAVDGGGEAGSVPALTSVPTPVALGATGTSGESLPTALAIPSGSPAMLPADHEADVDGGLGASAPKQVKFGVVLVTYAGSQDPKATRPKSAALALASELATTASTDFHSAVQRGDSGSMDDAGRLPRGMVEASTENVLFALAVGQVSAPIDTPRGYWIVKRLE